MGHDTETLGLRRQKGADLFHSARTNDHFIFYWDSYSYFFTDVLYIKLLTHVDMYQNLSRFVSGRHLVVRYLEKAADLKQSVDLGEAREIG